MKKSLTFLLIGTGVVLIAAIVSLTLVALRGSEDTEADRSIVQDTDSEPETAEEGTTTPEESADSQRALSETSCNTSQMFTPPKDDSPEASLLIARSSDGITFEEQGVFVEAAGVPSVTQGADGKLVAVFNWFPDYAENPTCYNKVAIMTSEDEGETWEGPFGLYVEDFPDELQLPFDPTITTTEEGTYRLFFTTHTLGMDEPFVYGTAVSDDGLHFTYDGIAFKGGEYDVVDGSAVLFGDTWIMIAPMAKQDGAALQASSTNGRSFSQMQSDRPDHTMYWVGNMTVVDGEVRFYGSCGIDSGLVGLCYSSTTDGVTWEDPVKTNSVNSDPGIVYTQSGTFLLLYPEAKTTTWPEESTDNRNR